MTRSRVRSRPCGCTGASTAPPAVPCCKWITPPRVASWARAVPVRRSTLLCDELIRPLVRRSIVDKDVQAVFLFKFERRWIANESAVIASADTWDQHPLAGLHDAQFGVGTATDTMPLPAR